MMVGENVVHQDRVINRGFRKRYAGIGAASIR